MRQRKTFRFVLWMVCFGIFIGGLISAPPKSADNTQLPNQQQKPENSIKIASEVSLAPCTSSTSVTSITVGQTVTGQLSADDCTLSDGSFVDLYSFNGVAGQQITISMDSSNFDSFLILRRELNGANVAQDDDSGGNRNARIPATGFLRLPATSSYLILARSYSSGSTGSYTLNLTSSNTCSYSLTPTSATFGVAGGSRSFSVTTFPPTGCNWTAVSNANWITTGSSGGGSGTATYTVAANSGAARSGTITVAGQTFTVTQAGPNGLFAAGDVFVAVNNGQVQWRRANGTLIQTLNTGDSDIMAGMAFDKDANLYVASFSSDKVYRFSPAGLLLGTFGSGYSSHPESIVFDRVGNVQVGQADGNRSILKFDPTGNLLATFTPARENRGMDWIELAEDQCTMFYTSEGDRIKRFNICTNTQLADFATGLPGTRAFALRLLPGGGLIVGDREVIARYDAAGNVVRTYAVSGEDSWFAINLDPDGTSFWSAGLRTGNVYKFDLASGNQLLNFNTGTPATSNGEIIGGLVIFGEIIVGGVRADLALTQTASPTPVAANSNLSYTLTVTNNGPDAATFVTVSDSLPAGLTYVSCSATGGGVCGGSGNNRTVSFASLTSGASATVTLVATATCPATTISNTASVSAPTSTDLNTSNNSATTNVTVNGCGGCPAITVNPANPALPAGVAGTDYTQTFTQTGGTGTIAFTISAGALPVGLGLNSTTGVLSGTPSSAGTFNFTVRASGANDCSGERAYTLVISGGSGGGGIVVTSAADVVANNGACTLREAILNANNNNQSGSTDCGAGSGRDTIRFNIPGAGPHRITPTSPLPTITDPVVLDAATQPGASCTTPGGLKVELSGANAGNAVGVNISAGNSVVRGLVVNRFADDGIRLHPNGGNLVSCNYVGTDVAGQAGLGNGVQGIQVHSPDNIIGGAEPGAGNLVSGNNNEGVNLVGYSGNRVLGNFIGTNANGTAAIPNNGSGVFMNSTFNNIVGGPGSARNVISGNGTGVVIFFSSSNLVFGNYIGTNAGGTLDLGNSGNGIFVAGQNSNSNVIGGPAGNGNVISGNDGSGIVLGSDPNTATVGTLVLGNYIGANAAGTGSLPNSLDGVTILANVGNTSIGGAAGFGNRIAFNGRAGVALTPNIALPITGVRIFGNEIFANGALGIDLSNSAAPNGVTANDPGDGDAGTNNLQNFPVLSSATSDGASTTVTGTLNSAANASFTVQFFSNPACDSSGHGEGQVFLGQTTVTTDANGNATINAALPVAAANGSFVTATATDASGNTSEFSSCRVVGSVTMGRLVRAACPSTPQSGTVRLPIELVSEGNENALSFSLNFDPAVLTSPQVITGSDAAPATLTINASQVAQGRIGILLALPGGQMFSAGTRQIAVVTFTIAANSPVTSTAVAFGDAPIRREISNANAQVLTAGYQGCTAISLPRGLEADVAPRPDGNGSVTVSDWIQVCRFTAGLDTAAAGSEFQRADSAPRETKGDGSILLTDCVQAGRYAAGLDPSLPAGGPTSQSLREPSEKRLTGTVAAAANGRGLRVAGTTFLRDRTNTVTIELDAQGNENAVGFSLGFNPAALSFVSASLGSDAAGALLNVNASQAASGRIGIAVVLPAGQKLTAGARSLVTLNFGVARGGNTATAALTFGDSPVRRQVADADAAALGVESLNATIRIGNPRMEPQPVPSTKPTALRTVPGQRPRSKATANPNGPVVR